MLKRLLLALLLLGAFGFGLTQLFLLRFQTGEIYPPYCSLRIDPLGTKAFYDALREMPHVELQRNFRAIAKLQPATPVTLLYAGTPLHAWWGDDELRSVEQLAVTGSHIVITFLPVDRGPTTNEAKLAEDEEKARKKLREEKRPNKEKDDPTKNKEDKKSRKEKETGEEKFNLSLSFLSFREVSQRWGFEFQFFSRLDPSAPPRRAKLQMPEAQTEPDLSWHTAMHFGKLKDTWRTLYAVEGQPVVMERAFGAGSIVLASDSYFLSNEALRNERAPALLAWLIGTPRAIVFDEDSHGVSDRPGVASLVRKYGLHGVAAGLALIAALFVWKNMSRFIPPLDDPTADGELVRGKEASEGFINLLRRSIAPNRVLGVCAEEWKRAFDHTGKSLKSAHLEKVLADELARPSRSRNPIAAYQTISHVLSQKK
jgi:hypothetical protein